MLASLIVLCLLSSIRADYSEEEIDAAVCERGPYGGNGGNHFSDSAHGAQWEITNIRVTYGSSIHSLQMTYGSIVGSKHGKEGPTSVNIMLSQGEYIVAIHGRAGKEVDQLTFFTNFRSLGPYGGSGGDEFFAYTKYPYTFEGRLRWISGRSNSRLDKISFHMQCH